MNKKRIIVIGCFLLLVCGCNSKTDEIVTNKSTQGKNQSNNQIKGSNKKMKEVKVTINNEVYTMKLENNNSVDSFIKLLPLGLNMTELNGNEKYIYLDKSLPTNPINPKHISIGDVMLYGDNCLVIFYKSFDTSYSYTKLGHIDNLSDLGNGDIFINIDNS